MGRIFATALVLGLALGLGATTAVAGSIVFDQGFETDTSDWIEYGGSITQVATGTGGITSATGANHALFGESGQFTRFDGYRDTWTGEWTARVDVYLDTTWAAGSGFDWSVASSGSDGAHQRDFIFHVAKDTSTGGLLVAGSNNSNFNTREDLDTLDHYEVTQSGWYTFESRFYDDAGALAVDLNLYALHSGSPLFTETRSDPSDLIATEIGGNRYGWFTFVDVTGGIAVDTSQLEVSAPVPEPTTVLLSLAGWAGLAGVARRRRRS